VKANMKILVADDQEAIRKRVCSILMSRGNCEICAEATNGKEAVEQAKDLNPDLIILDITMPLLNGLDAARMIRNFSPETPILILSVHKNKQLMEEARKIGVRGYVTKAEAGQDLIIAVNTVLQNQTFFPTEF
jgi:DNA-binding NarL/FixJ family response regulator